jgi:hypothetical protein
MPIKARTPKGRRPSFPPDVLALFVELEGMSRRDPRFKAGERELACRLGLTGEYWTMNSVLDRSRRSCHPPGYIARDDWFRCRAVREQLLAAAAEAQRRQL